MVLFHAMTCLWVASVFPLFLATEGLRRTSRRPSVMDVPNEYPASPACLIGAGFGIKRGCQYPQAMQPLPTCEGSSRPEPTKEPKPTQKPQPTTSLGFPSTSFDPGFGPIPTTDRACVLETSDESVSGYLRDVRSTSDFSSLVRSVSEVEGGGIGWSVSASFSYMKRSQVSERSIAFFIGASARSHTRTIQDPIAMKLTPTAKALLQENPREFIELYGLRYIHGISYGGSFLGSVTLNSIETKDEKDVQACANFSATGGLFSASGSTEFQNTVSQYNLDISTFINAQWVGGHNIVQDYRTPETLNNMFQQWDSSWRLNPAPKLITTRRWIDSEEVQEIVKAMSDEDKELFYADDVTKAIQTEISKEVAQVTLTQTSVNLALVWKEVEADQSTKSCLTQLSNDLTAKLITVSLLDDSSVLNIQERWLLMDYSWFQAGELHNRYLQCVKDVKLRPEVRMAYTNCDTVRGRDLMYLDRHVVQCNSGESLGSFRLTSSGCSSNLMRFEYACLTYSGWDSRQGTVGYTPCNEGAYLTLEYMDRHNVSCNQGYALGSWQLTRSGCGNKDVRFRYACDRTQLESRTTKYTLCQEVYTRSIDHFEAHHMDCGSDVLTGFRMTVEGCAIPDQRVEYTCSRPS